MDEVLRDELLALRAAADAARVRPAREWGLLDDDTPELRAACNRGADRLAEIVRKSNWPNATDVGPEAAEAAWRIAMEALGRREFMVAWAWDLARSAQEGEAHPTHVAAITDRTRVLRGKEQIYGLELDWDASGLLSPLPITQPETVDVRRESVRLVPLQDWLAEARARAAALGDRPPADPAARRRRHDALLAETGWRRG